MKSRILNNALLLLLISISGSLSAQTTLASSQEQYRPKIHFTPQKGWMNDPNGMVYLNGTYHLFFQYYPDSTIWGPMHWGHATSKDMIRWKEQPIALYPDSLGYIFSGSAVVDTYNTSGFGKNGKAPLVAIFTHHDMKGEKRGSIDFQQQSIAYSNDEGKSWTKYAGNPVVKNPGIRDFRDPKVIWFEAGKKWIMVLAVQDHVSFYSSPDLKQWTKESDFGKERGAHGGVWECPELLRLELNGKKVWVLLVSINPGAPNGGSATQYFAGEFNGNSFIPSDIDTKFMDYGTDNYAGVTFSNTGNRKVLMGWMSNWQYAQVVPTRSWRSAMTVPRDLSLKQLNGKTYLVSKPAKELDAYLQQALPVKTISIKKGTTSKPFTLQQAKPFVLNLNTVDEDISIELSNELNETLIIGYDKNAKTYFIDRSRAGKADFDTGFAKKHLTPRLISGPVKLKLIVDVASVELFADDGLAVMTDIVFPNQPYQKLSVRTDDAAGVCTIQYLK